MDPKTIGIVLLVLAVIVLVIWQVQLHAERERKRRADLAEFARQNGMDFSQDDRWNLGARYQGVADIGRGHNRYALDVLMRGGESPLAVFRYHFKTWETRTVTRNGRTRTERYEKTHWRQYLVLETGSAFPHFTLRPEGLFDKLAGFVGFDDIDFESEQFSKRYFCKSENKEFAYAIVHPPMMEYLMDLGLAVELHNRRLIMDLGGAKFDVDRVHRAMAGMTGFINRIPDFVWQDYANRSPLRLPDPDYTPPEPVQTA